MESCQPFKGMKDKNEKKRFSKAQIALLLVIDLLDNAVID
jgi:hypothetical protein